MEGKGEHSVEQLLRRGPSGPLARLLGASDLLLDDTVTYLRVQLCFAPMAMLQLLFESFFVTAGRPGLGLGLATAAGVTNAVLDYLYMGPMQMGILGAALGTVTGYSIPAVAGVLFFLLRRQVQTEVREAICL